MSAKPQGVFRKPSVYGGILNRKAFEDRMWR
jgi:hypothetical protein